MSGDKTFETHVLEDKHRQEVAALKKKLQWFAENQELLDRDAGRLKDATAEIHRLREQVRSTVIYKTSSSELPLHAAHTHQDDPRLYSRRLLTEQPA